MEPPYGGHYSQERNPRAYMTMRDYRNLQWQWQQPVESEPNPYRSMREYRDQWIGTPSYSVPPTYAPQTPPYYASIPQPPQLPSPIEQAILNLSKLVDDFVEDNRAVKVQANQEIETVESPLNQGMEVFQGEIDQEFDTLQQSISSQEEENMEEECLSETIVGEQAQLQPQEELKEEPTEAPPEELQDAPQLCVVYGPWKKEEETAMLPTEKANGKEEMEEPWNATTQPLYSPLPVCILPSSAAKSLPKTPVAKPKATPSLHALKNFKKLVVVAQTLATTSKTLAATHVAWHSGWFGCRFGSGAPEPRKF